MARKSKRLNHVTQAPTITMPIYNVAIYIRISHEENIRNVGTLEYQKQISLEYIKDKSDMVLYEIYCDDGKSGTNFDREGFQQMMYDVYNGKVNCIVVKDLSRFGREYIEMGEYVEKIFPLLGVRFIAINDNVDNHVSPYDVSVPIKNVINALYAKDTSRKVSAAFRTKQLNGDYIGGFGPYGYVKSEDDIHKLVVDPEAARVVKMIYNWKLEGYGVVSICRMLVANGIAPPGKYKYDKGIFKSEKYANMKYWREATVMKILTNEMYIGNMVQGRTKRSLYNNMPLRLMDKDHWIIVENTHEAIISKEDFCKVQDMLAEYDRKPAVRKTHKKENIFKGKVICGECGHKMTRTGSSDRKNKNHFYCRHHAIYKDESGMKSIREDILTNIVHQSIKMQIMSLTRIENSMQRSANSPETKQAMYSLTKQISETLSTVAYIKENRVRIAKDYAMQMLNEEEYDILRNQFELELTQAAEKLELLEKQRCKFNKLFTADRWISELRQYSSSKKLSASMLNEFVKCVKVYADSRIEIEWKHTDTLAEYFDLANGGDEYAG